MRAAFVEYGVSETEAALDILCARACDLTKLLKAEAWTMESIIVEIRSATFHVPGHPGLRMRDGVALAVAEAIKCFYESERAK